MPRQAPIRPSHEPQHREPRESTPQACPKLLVSKVRLWDPATGAQIGNPLTDHTNAVSAVAFGALPDGRGRWPARATITQCRFQSQKRLWLYATGWQPDQPRRIISD
jgi:hypothetical protein